MFSRKRVQSLQASFRITVEGELRDLVIISHKLRKHIVWFLSGVGMSQNRNLYRLLNNHQVFIACLHASLLAPLIYCWGTQNVFRISFFPETIW